ncbi:hypothetical protein EJB05_15631, partial [Eragrostis curvula]
MAAAAAVQPASSSSLTPRFLRFRLRTAQNPNLHIPARAVAPRPSLLHSTPTPAAPDPDADPLRVAFACGAPGGRVYSVIALADELHASLPGSRSLILGAPAPSLESTAAAAASYPFAPVPRCLPRAVLAAAVHLRRFNPHVLVATGGSASLPACLAALLLGLAFVIQDQDASPAPATRRSRSASSSHSTPPSVENGQGSVLSFRN